MNRRHRAKDVCSGDRPLVAIARMGNNDDRIRFTTTHANTEFVFYQGSDNELILHGIVCPGCGDINEIHPFGDDGGLLYGGLR